MATYGITTANPALSTGDATFGVTDAQKAAGIAANPTAYNNATSPNINSSTLAPQADISYQTPTTPTTPSIAGIDTTTQNTANTLGVNEQKASDLSTSIEAGNTTLAGKSAFQTEQNNLAGVDSIQQAINDNNTAVKQLQNDANAASVTAEGRTASTFAVSAEQGAIDRTRAVKALGLSSISDALSNNLVSAQHKADQAVEAKYGPLEAEQKAKLANLDLILKDPATTLETSKRATAQKQIEQAKADQIAQAKTDTATILKSAQEAATNASTFTKTAQYSTLSQALSAVANAKTPAEADAIRAATGLIPSTNKSQVVGSADTGYSNVVTDSSGKVISVTPVTGGTGVGAKSTKPFTPAEIAQYQVDYPDAGIKIGDSPASIEAKINPKANIAGATFNGLTAILPTGGTLTFPNQAALDQFKKDNGIAATPSATPTATQLTSPIEKDIAQMKKSGILTNGDIAAALAGRYSKQEITNSSVGFVGDKISGFFSSLFSPK